MIAANLPAPAVLSQARSNVQDGGITPPGGPAPA